MKTFCQRMTADEAIWKFLDIYTDVLNQRLKDKGWPKVSKARVIGAILSHFLLENRDEIFQEHELQLLEDFVTRAGRLAGSDLPVAESEAGTPRSLEDVAAAIRAGRVAATG